MRYVDMKIITASALPSADGSNVDATLAKLAADLYVRQSPDGPAERRVQEISGLKPPVAYIPVALGDPHCWALVREDTFDAAVLVELARREAFLSQLQEVLLTAQSNRAAVPDNDYGNLIREERTVCSGGGSTGDPVKEELQGEPS